MLQYLIVSNHVGFSKYLCNSFVSVDFKIHLLKPQREENVFPRLVIRNNWGNRSTLKLLDGHQNVSFAPRFPAGNFTSVSLISGQWEK